MVVRQRRRVDKNTTVGAVTQSNDSSSAAASAASAETKRTSRASATPAQPSTCDAPPTEEPIQEESIWVTLKGHWATPLLVITAVITIPYYLYWAFWFVILQRPHWIFFMTLRPPVAISDPRPLLVVGSMSSGTSQVAHQLAAMGLEIGHELSDTLWYPVRDGTVSWFHGIRYLPRTVAVLQYSIPTICESFLPSMGFHPAMFRASPCGSFGTVSAASTWSSCWRRECHQLLYKEWGCALPTHPNIRNQQERGEEEEFDKNLHPLLSQPCLTPFHRVLHQVRHPLRTIESLVAKFCINGTEGQVQPSFQRVTYALFFPGTNMSDVTPWSCIETAARYMVQYNRAMMDAMEQLQSIDGRYRIETTTPCQVAEMAGLVSIASPSVSSSLKDTSVDPSFFLGGRNDWNGTAAMRMMVRPQQHLRHRYRTQFINNHFNQPLIGSIEGTYDSLLRILSMLHYGTK